MEESFRNPCIIRKRILRDSLEKPKGNPRGILKGSKKNAEGVLREA